MDDIQISNILWKMLVRQFTNEVVLFDGLRLQAKVSRLLKLLGKVNFLNSACISGCVLLRAGSLPNKWLVLPFLYKLCFKMLKVLFVCIEGVDVFGLLD